VADNPFEDRNHKLGIGLDFWQYKEPGIMKDSGGLYGAEYEFRNVFFDYLFTQFSVDLFLGRTQYEGRYLSSNEPLEFEQTNIMASTQAHLGLAIPIGNGWAVIPKVGVYYRTLTDANDESGADYQRDQTYFVIPVGLEIVYNTLDYRQFIVGAWVSTSFSGTNKTHLTDVGGDRDLTLKQDEGGGFEVYGTYSFNTYYVGFTVRAWTVEDSEFKDASLPALGPGLTTFLEPKNETVAVGGRVGFSF